MGAKRLLRVNINIIGHAEVTVDLNAVVEATKMYHDNGDDYTAMGIPGLYYYIYAYDIPYEKFLKLWAGEEG